MLLQIPQWAHLDGEKKKNLVGLEVDIAELSSFLNQEGSLSLLGGRMKMTLINSNDDEDDFFGLQKLFYFA